MAYFHQVLVTLSFTFGVNAGLKCGVSIIPHSRIINGKDALPGAWPWIASFQYKRQHHCGGTLLTPKWVLTASHCVQGINPQQPKDWTVILGAHDLRYHEVTAQERSIKRIVVHPFWNPNDYTADLALLELSSPVIITARVNVACLPEEGVYPPLGKECFIAGWGSIKYPGNMYHTLQQAKLPVVHGHTCKWQDEVVCVGKGFKSQSGGKQQPNACQGDSGGPLVCRRNDGRWQVDGAASFVHTFCKYYTGYSPVNKYLYWIKSQIRQ